MVLIVIPLAAVLWLIMARGSKPNTEATATHEAVTEPETKAETQRGQNPASESEKPLEQTPTVGPKAAREQHEAALTLASASSEHEPGDPSHPITPEHRLIYRQNYLIGQIDGAILVEDYEGIRRLNAEYRREYPDDDEPTREAYDMIADCLENKTPERVARARKFWETKRSSRARRDLRRSCLE
jgi:hypothetical protein